MFLVFVTVLSVYSLYKGVCVCFANYISQEA